MNKRTMNKRTMNKRAWICLLMLLLSVYPLKAGLRMEFEALGTEAGLAVNYVVSIAQLKDNRIVAVTMDDVNIWDGHSFQRIRKSREEFTPIPGYQGHYTHTSTKMAKFGLRITAACGTMTNIGDWFTVLSRQAAMTCLSTITGIYISSNRIETTRYST